MSKPVGFFEQNRTAIVAGLATLAVVGGLFYYSQLPLTVVQTPKSSKKKNKKKKSSSKKASSDAHSLHGFALEKVDASGPEYPVIDDSAKLKPLSEADRKELGDALKVAGNYAFNKKQSEKALEFYSKAIECNPNDAIYYSNRAAVYGQLGENEKVVEDATKALDIRPDYVKCFSRRGVAYEKLQNYSEAVMDFTAACILSNFEDDNLGKAVDRVLRLQAEQVIKERFGEDSTSKDYPSPTFISSYLSSFHKRELPQSVVDAEEGTGEYDLKLAFEAMDKENLESYKQATKYLEDAISKGLGSPEAEALAYEYRATFRFLLNDQKGAMEDIAKSLEIHPTAQAMIKQSSLNVEMGRLDEADRDFKEASKLDPKCADIHYQLAQLDFLQQNWPSAVKNYEQAIELDDSFLLAHIQLAVTKYRMGQQEVAKRKFQKLIEKYPDNSNAHNYYGEILLDLGNVQDAIAEFDKAIELENKKKTAAISVLPLINKSLALVQAASSASDLDKGVELCRKAIAIDPASDIAIGTLAQFCLQQGKIKEAIELFERNASLARTKPEQIQAMTFAEAARTQHRIATERPILRERLEILSRVPR